MLMDVASIQSAVACLPQRARWLIRDVPLDFSFESEPRNLTTVLQELLMGGKQDDPPIVERVRDYVVFGEWDYAEGGGAHPLLLVRRSDAKVFGLEVENDAPLFLMNSSLLAFINTFYLLDEYLGHNKKIPDDLGSSVRNLDPGAYSMSHWHDVVTELFRERD